MLTTEDLKTLEQKGVTQEELESQINRFKTGFPFLKIADSAQIGNGIKQLSAEEEFEAVARWKKYLADGGEVCKFVPASGAASRMFKALFSFVEGDADVPAEGSDVAKLIADIHNLAFFGELNEVVKNLHSKDIDTLISEGEYKKVIAAIILPEGLNYGNLPKGLLTFHAYADGTTRTPVEEQLVEGAQSATGADGVVHLHFTVSMNLRKRTRTF